MECKGAASVIESTRAEFARQYGSESIIAEALLLAKMALETRVPKKPLPPITKVSPRSWCPICKMPLGDSLHDVERDGKRPKFCSNCGQAIDWCEGAAEN